MSDADAEGAATTAEHGLWQVTIAFLATAAQHEQLMDRLVEVLCPDSSREGPCPIPWGVHSVNGESLSRKKRKALREDIAETGPDPVRPTLEPGSVRHAEPGSFTWTPASPIQEARVFTSVCG
ncbi:hypothetical protein ACFWVP_04010 [Streptomyces sp. NPDC058637]|uniref:hypothetical protein n=1 Tax=Streptomyces sp. NPDC058637 TaxID=3346569 RepID=UPI003647243E